MAQETKQTDFLVIGGGVIGLNVALELKRRYSDCSVSLIEKEDAPGQHASGRNSGVLHAGFYYTADSLKARFCREGNAEMQRFCAERNLRINRCGKLVVAKSEAEWSGLDELYRRGCANGVVLQSLSEAEARQIEPRVRTCQRALFSPNTATVDPAETMAAFTQEAHRLGVELYFDTAYQGRSGSEIRASKERFSAGYVVNAAGLYADRIARDFGFSARYRILPFKGLYLYSSEPPGAFRTNIYPIPDLRNPFLGVHFTVTAEGRAKIGPTAIPCFWREHYGGTARFRWEECREILALEANLLVRAGFDFRGLAWQEVQKYSRAYLVAQAAQLAEGVRLEDYAHWGRPGIRAQLMDIESRTLVMDFLLEGDAHSLHVLNAVSPAFTCALPFSRYVCDEIAAYGSNGSNGSKREATLS